MPIQSLFFKRSIVFVLSTICVNTLLFWYLTSWPIRKSHLCTKDFTAGRDETFESISKTGAVDGIATFIAGNIRKTKGFLTIGVPTCKRSHGSYLWTTLHQLVNQTSAADKLRVVVVILFSKSDTAFKDANETLAKFREHFDSGFMRMITVPEGYYPKLTGLKRTYGDDENRVIWRSRQNLDYALLINYSHNISQYYLQIEDDVLALPGYMRDISLYIDEQAKETWTMLEFSHRGFIGKLYKSEDLPKLASILRLFFNEKPCDFVLIDFNHLMLQHKRYIHVPALFKHFGHYSSLGKQSRKIYSQIEEPTSFIQDNPPANVYHSMKVFRNSLELAYRRRGSFLASNIKPGDVATIVFEWPIPHIKQIVIITGESSKTLTGRVKGASFQLGTLVEGIGERTCSDFKTVADFKDGRVSYTGPDMNDVRCIRMMITMNQETRLVISTIEIVT